MSARRLGVLVRGLPADSATIRTVAPAAAWGTTDELLATLVELTDARWSWFFDVHAKPHAKRPVPLRIARPGVPPTAADDEGTRHGRTTRRPAEVVTYLRRFAPPKEEVTVDG